MPRTLQPASVRSLWFAAFFSLSLSPTFKVAGHAIPTPNYFVATAVPALRAGQRLAMPLMGALTILAGVGASHLLKSYADWRKYLVFVALICVLSIDLWAPFPDSSNRVVYSAAILQLRALPDGRVAQYQADSLVGYPAGIICLAQMGHGKSVINDCGVANDESRFAAAASCTARRVAAMSTVACP